MLLRLFFRAQISKLRMKLVCPELSRITSIMHRIGNMELCITLIFEAEVSTRHFHPVITVGE